MKSALLAFVDARSWKTICQGPGSLNDHPPNARIIFNSGFFCLSLAISLNISRATSGAFVISKVVGVINANEKTKWVSRFTGISLGAIVPQLLLLFHDCQYPMMRFCESVFAASGFGWSQCDWHPGFAQNSLVVPQKPNSLQQTFNGHDLPGGEAFLPHCVKFPLAVVLAILIFPIAARFHKPLCTGLPGLLVQLTSIIIRLGDWRDAGGFISVYVRVVVMPAVDTDVAGVVMVKTMPKSASSAAEHGKEGEKNE